jgi:hypothetical protein
VYKKFLNVLFCFSVQGDADQFIDASPPLDVRASGGGQPRNAASSLDSGEFFFFFFS